MDGTTADAFADVLGIYAAWIATERFDILDAAIGVLSAAAMDEARALAVLRLLEPHQDRLDEWPSLIRRLCVADACRRARGSAPLLGSEGLAIVERSGVR